MKLYGIKNCDTVKKTKKLLEAKSVDFEFVDYREQPVDPNLISTWLTQVGQGVLLNTRSTTWRNLSESERNEDILKLFACHPTLMKRPILEKETGEIVVGFKDIEKLF